MSGAAARKFTWMAAEAYPIFVVIGGAMGLCGFQLARCVSQNPDCKVFKSTRSEAVPEQWDDQKNGSKFHDHAIRRFVRPYAGGGIMKQVNIYMSKPSI